MKKNAFTLLELLGVVIILGVLSLITFPIILNQIKNAKQGIKDSTKTLIIDAAKDYYEDNTNNYDLIEGMTYCINISTLTDNNYLNKKIKDDNLNDIDITKKVKMIYHNNKFNYDITDTCNNNSLTRNNIEVPIETENSGLYKSQTDIDRFIYRGGDSIKNWIELNEGTEQSPNYVKYRIISFENDGTIKVVREDSLDYMYYDDSSQYETENRNSTSETSFCSSDSGCNIWGSENNTYYNEKLMSETNAHFYRYRLNDDFTDYIFTSDHGRVTEDSTLNKYLNNTWISTKEMGKYITNHNFYVGGIYYSGSNIKYEKSLQLEKKEEQTYIWNGKIGLINLTEYVEASTNPTCTNVFSTFYYNPNYYYDGAQHLNELNDWPCSNTDYTWIYNGTSFYTMDRGLDYKAIIWRATTTGFLNTNEVKTNFIKARPAFYLKSSLSLTGEGSETNPYRIVGES